MEFTAQILSEISPMHLLKHPFYQAWTEGKLTKDELKTYARQYYHHVAAFPRYISATHSGCDDIKSRQVLLENLTDEEQGELNHPELWLRFAESLGESRANVKGEELLPQTCSLIETFMKFSKSSYAEGLGALLAYEYQVPDVAASKIAGLKKYYNIESEDGLKFFDVHLKADIYHTDAVKNLVNALSSTDKEKALHAAHEASKALWNFLDGVTPPTAIAC
jgi:pyrroloquinoline-quinone synthase